MNRWTGWLSTKAIPPSSLGRLECLEPNPQADRSNRLNDAVGRVDPGLLLTRQPFWRNNERVYDEQASDNFGGAGNCVSSARADDKHQAGKR